MKQKTLLLLPLSMFIDTLCLNIAFGMAYYLKFENLLTVFNPPYFLLLWIMNALWFLILLVIRPYNENRLTFKLDILIYYLLKAIFLHSCLVAIFWISIQANYFSRLQLFYCYIIQFILGGIWRLIGIHFLKKYRKLGYNLKNYIVFGSSKLSSEIIDFYEKHREIGYQFKGYYYQQYNLIDEAELKWDFENLKNDLKTQKIDYVYCCLQDIKTEQLQEIITLSEQYKFSVKILMNYHSFISNGINIEYHDHIPIINISTRPFSDFKSMFIKRTFDVVFSLGALILGTPLFIILAIITKFTSNGPILFKQERTGQWGRKFKIFKFRSMYVDADEIALRNNNKSLHSMGDDDPRITNWGRFMRKSRLDELPQFINVLKGEMSVVGPRPLASYDVQMLMDNAPDDFRRLLTIKPGITSVGQLSYGYATDEEGNTKRLKYDLEYLNNNSIVDDLKLIFMTLRVVFKAVGR